MTGDGYKTRSSSPSAQLPDLLGTVSDFLVEASSSPAHSVDSAALRTASFITTACRPGHVEEFCWSLWSSVVEAVKGGSSGLGHGARRSGDTTTTPRDPADTARVTDPHYPPPISPPADADGSAGPETLSHLVTLVEAIKRADPLLTPDGEVAGCWAGRCWEDLPCLGAVMREEWNFSEDQIEDPSQFTPWCNLQRFAILLTARGVCDLRVFGFWQLRAALEGAVEFCPSGPARYTLPVAHLWVHGAGRELREWARLQSSTGEGGGRGGGRLWLHTLHLDNSADRWEFWKARCRELSDPAGELSSEPELLRQQAAEMFRCMDGLS